MKKGGGKRKGAGYEREKCKQLSLWLSDGERTDIFWRSAMSGGRATLDAKARKSQSGDIVATAKEGCVLIDLFCFECKRYQSLYWDRAINGGSSGFMDKWKKLVYEANRAQKMPVMLTLANRGIELCITNASGWLVLQTGQRQDKPELVAWLALVQLGVYGFKLEEVINRIDPHALRIPRRKLYSAAPLFRLAPH